MQDIMRCNIYSLGLLNRLPETLRSPFIYLLIAVCGILVFGSYLRWNSNIKIQQPSRRVVERKPTPANTGTMQLAVTICGNRLEEGMVLLKSVTLLTRSQFHVYIFASNDLTASITNELNRWPLSFRNNMSYTLLPIQFLKVPDEKVWRSLFRPCASQRLFLPLILKDVEAIVYVDSDVLFLRPLDDLWQIFYDFNETQISALTPETEGPDGNWYLEHPQTPRVSPYGVNTGVFLMNTTRMRGVEWLRNITSLYQLHKNVVKLGDQDLVNIYFSIFPERLHLIPCHWNYRSDHCSYKSNCESSKTTGVSLIHGNRNIFHSNGQPIFREIYKTFRDYRFDEDLEKFFSNRMLKILLNGGETKCEGVAKIFFKQLYENVVRLLKESRSTS